MLSRSLLTLLILSCTQLQAIAQPANIPSRQDTLKGSITHGREWLGCEVLYTFN